MRVVPVHFVYSPRDVQLYERLRIKGFADDIAALRDDYKEIAGAYVWPDITS